MSDIPDHDADDNAQDVIKRILVVDDEEAVLDILSYFLSDAGYDVTVFSDPNEAINSIESQKFDLLITDLLMPGVDGFELIEHASTHIPDCKSMIITGNPSPEAEERARRLGVVEFIPKPFRTDQIVEAVQKAIGD